MALSLIEVLQTLEQHRHYRSVWYFVLEKLNKFVDNPERGADPQGIATEGCVSKTVSQEVLQDVIQSILDEKIIPLEEEIANLENLNVVETKDEPKASTAKPVANPGKKVTKGIRIIASAPKAGGGNGPKAS